MARPSKAERDDLYSVTIAVANPEVLARVLRLPGIDAGCRHANVERGKDGFRFAALVPAPLLAALRREKSVTVTAVKNATEASRASLAYVGKGNRYARDSEVPRGLGKLI